MRRITAIAALAAAACSPAERGTSGACDDACDVATKQNISQGPMAMDCSLSATTVSCVLNDEVAAITLSSAAVAVRIPGQEEPVGAVLNRESTVFHHVLTTPVESVEVSARFTPSSESSKAIGAEVLGDLTAESTVVVGEPAILELPVEVWTMELLGYASRQDVRFEIPGSLTELGETELSRPVTINAGARQLVQVVTELDSSEIAFALGEDDSTGQGAVDHAGVFAVRETTMLPALDEELPGHAEGTPAVTCEHDGQLMFCKIPESTHGAVGKVHLRIIGDDGVIDSTTITSRFPLSLPIAAEELPVTVKADVAVTTAWALPNGSKSRFSLQTTVTTDEPALISLPFELWKITISSDVDLATFRVAPYTQEFGRTTADWFRYVVDDLAFSLGALGPDTRVQVILAVPPGTTSLETELKIIFGEETIVDEVKLLPGHALVSPQGLLQGT